MAEARQRLIVRIAKPNNMVMGIEPSYILVLEEIHASDSLHMAFYFETTSN